MTRAQRKVYDAIESFITKNKYSPSYEDLCAATGHRSLSTIHKHVQALRFTGFVRMNDNCGRTLELVNREDKVRTLPVSYTVFEQFHVAMHGCLPKQGEKQKLDMTGITLEVR